MDVDNIVKATLQAEILKAFNAAPEAIEKMVQAALSKPVDKNGKSDGWSGDKLPYIDYLVGEEIRRAASAAIRTIIAEKVPMIEDMVRKGLQDETIVKAIVKSFVGAAQEEWRISVKFESDKSS